MRRRSIIKSIGGIGAGMIATSGITSATSEPQIATKEDLDIHSSDEESMLVAKWTDEHYFHNTMSGVVEGRAFAVEYQWGSGWVFDFGLSGIGAVPDNPHWDDLWGHELQIGPPDEGDGDLLWNLNHGGVYPNDDDSWVPNWVPPFVAPVASQLSDSTLPGWLKAGYDAISDEMGDDDDGISGGMGTNYINYKNSNSFLSFNSLGATLVCALRTKLETGNPLDDNTVSVPVKGAYKMDTGIWSSSWEGFDSELLMTENHNPSNMTTSERDEYGIKKIEKNERYAKMLDRPAEDLPDFIVTNPQGDDDPLIDVGETEKISFNERERSDYFKR